MFGLTLGQLDERRVRGGCNETNDRTVLSCECSDYLGGMVWKKDEVILANSSNKLEIELHQSDRGNYICCVKDSCYDPTSKCSWSSNQLTTLSHLPGVDAKLGEVNMLAIALSLILVFVVIFVALIIRCQRKGHQKIQQVQSKGPGHARNMRCPQHDVISYCYVLMSEDPAAINHPLTIDN